MCVAFGDKKKSIEARHPYLLSPVSLLPFSPSPLLRVPVSQISPRHNHSLLRLQNLNRLIPEFDQMHVRTIPVRENGESETAGAVA